MNFLEKMEEKAQAFEQLMQEESLVAAKEALPIMQKIEAALESKAGLLVESLVPNGTTYAAVVEELIKDAEEGLTLIAGINKPGQLKGLLQRLGTEITAAIHGGKKDISFYVHAFEYVIGASATAA